MFPFPYAAPVDKLSQSGVFINRSIILALLKCFFGLFSLFKVFGADKTAKKSRIKKPVPLQIASGFFCS